MISITLQQPVTRDSENPPPEGGVAGNVPKHVLDTAAEGHDKVQETPDTGWESVVQANVTDTPEFGL